MCNNWVDLHLCHVNIYPSYIYRLFAQSFSTPEVEILVQKFATHDNVRIAAFMKLHLHGLILSTRSYQSENLFPLEISISCFDVLLLDGTL